MRIEQLLQHFSGVKHTGDGQWQALCPAHDDQRPSLSIGVDGRKILIRCHAGCPLDAVLEASGLAKRDLYIDDFPNRKQISIEANYDYRDAEGNLVFQVVRTQPKGFFQRRPDGSGGWVNKLDGVHPVLYHLPELLNAPAASIVYIPEGEKDVDRLIECGLCATTNPGGAGKWRPEYNQYLRARRVVVLPDNDQSGEDHAARIQKSLRGVASQVVTLLLPDLPDKGDVSDWLADHDAPELAALAQAAMQNAQNRDGFTAAELLSQQFPEPSWIAEGLLCEGVTLLVGPAKIGKSWLSLDLALSVAAGTPVLGTGSAKQGSVLLLDLEGNPRRAKKRLQMLLGDNQAPDSLHIYFEWPRLDEGGIEKLRSFLQDHKDTKLIIVDTLACVRSRKSAKRSIYDDDYRDLAGLHSLTAVTDGLAVVVVHHTRKERRESAGDPVQEINGTMGLSASADALIGMRRAKAPARFDIELTITGRDVRECSLALAREAGVARWTVLGDVHDYGISEQRQKVLDFLERCVAGAPPKAIAEGTGLSHDSVRHLVGKMVDDGQILRPSNGIYTLHPVHSFTGESEEAQPPTDTGETPCRTNEPHPSEQSERSDAESIAHQRTLTHVSHSTNRPLSPSYDLVGVAGERAFSEAFGLPMDALERLSGDGGVDFTLPSGLTVDVKTYRKPLHLLREVDRDEAQILVLAAYSDVTGDARLIGWEWDREMLKCPTNDFGYGITSHYKPAGELQPIALLHELVRAG